MVEGVYDKGSVRLGVGGSNADRRELSEMIALARSDFPRLDDRRMGVRHYSPLFDVPGFDAYKQTPVEPLHNVVSRVLSII